MPVIACPNCGTKLNAPDSVLGHDVVCGRCKRSFVAKAAEGAADSDGLPPIGQPVAPATPAAGGPPSFGPPATPPGVRASPGLPGTPKPPAPPSPGQQVAPAGPTAPAAPGRPVTPVQPIASQFSRPAAAAPLPSAAGPGPGAPAAGPGPGPRPPVAPPAPPGLYAPPPVPPMGFVQQERKTSGFAIASLVLGICSMPTCFCLGLPAIICGILAIVFYNRAMTDIRAGLVSASSTGLAKAGRICGMIGICLGIGYWVFYGTIFAIGLSQR